MYINNMAHIIDVWAFVGTLMMCGGFSPVGQNWAKNLLPSCVCKSYALSPQDIMYFLVNRGNSFPTQGHALYLVMPSV